MLQNLQCHNGIITKSLLLTDPRDALPQTHVLFIDGDGQCDKLVIDDH